MHNTQIPGGRSSRPWPTVDEWVARYPLRRVGKEYVGQCPLCGGYDRFHIREGSSGHAVGGCRGCVDGQGDAGRKRWAEIVAKVFGDESPVLPPPKPKAKLVSTTTRLGLEAFTRATALDEEPDDCPGYKYLRYRRVLHVSGAKGFVRWLARANAQDLHLPPTAAGALLFGWHKPGSRSLTAVSMEGLTEAGRLPQPERWRKTYGVRRGSVFACRSVATHGGKRANQLFLCEGEVSALALTVLNPGAAVWALGGTSGDAALSVAVVAGVLRGLEVVIDTDGDRPGHTAARRWEATLKAADQELKPASVKIKWRALGKDAADEARDRPVVTEDDIQETWPGAEALP